MFSVLFGVPLEYFLGVQNRLRGPCSRGPILGKVLQFLSETVFFRFYRERLHLLPQHRAVAHVTLSPCDSTPPFFVFVFVSFLFGFCGLLLCIMAMLAPPCQLQCCSRGVIQNITAPAVCVPNRWAQDPSSPRCRARLASALHARASAVARRRISLGNALGTVEPPCHATLPPQPRRRPMQYWAPPAG